MSGNGMDAVRGGLARGLARFVAPARLPEGFAPAFAQKPEGGVFDLAANAAAAEALAQPMLGGGDGAVALLLALAGGPGPAPRAIGPARVVVEDAAPRDFRITTPHHLFTGNLFRGEIRQHLHGTEGAPAAIHGGNLVEFAYRRRWHCLDVEDAIVAAGIEDAEGGVRLYHESVLSGRGGRFTRGGPRELARLRYDYDLRADTPVVTVTVTLTPLPGVVLDRPRITTACDAMSPGDGVDYATLVIGEVQRPSPAGENVTIQQGPVAGFGARQQRTPSRALCLQLTPRGPATLLSVKASGPAEERLHWLLTRYAGTRLAAGESLTQREDRLLLRGTEAPFEAPRGADAASAAPRQRIAAALAMQALFGDAAKAPILTAAARRNLAALSEAETAPAELAHALMASEVLFRAARNPDDRAQIDALAARLLATQIADGTFREPGGASASIAEHATALLALARRLALDGVEAAGAALRRGIAALALITLPGPVDTITLPTTPAAGTEELAMLLRALRAAQAARAAGTLAMPEAEARRLAFLADLALRFLQARFRPDGDALVVDGGVSVQVAALAALVPPEGALR
ncbi:hypothetical protein AAFN86_16840 [Roseomonas sp. CAU 1739]|uniref:hypothetical protein n=1 Tax=Roseomonas sp. CAU 1739 TaxID=3140364 RepID=UPI00325A6C19